MITISKRIKYSGLSLETLASATGISISRLSEIIDNSPCDLEEGHTLISILCPERLE